MWPVAGGQHTDAGALKSEAGRRALLVCHCLLTQSVSKLQGIHAADCARHDSKATGLSPPARGP